MGGRDGGAAGRLQQVHPPGRQAVTGNAAEMLAAWAFAAGADEGHSYKSKVALSICKPRHFKQLDSRLSAIDQFQLRPQSSVCRDRLSAITPATRTKANIGQSSGSNCAAVLPLSRMPRTMRKKCVKGSTSPIH